MKTIMYIVLTLISLSCGSESQPKDIKRNIDSKTEKHYSGIIIHSYSSDHICGAPQAEGIKTGFTDNEISIKWKEFFMDSKILNISTESRMELSSEYLNYIKTNTPDIIFLLDDNAIKFVGMELVGSDIPIVFSGMNGQKENYNSIKKFTDESGNPLFNMTGVYEYLYSAESFITFDKILPDFKQIVALIDSTTTGMAVKIQLEKELKANVNIPDVNIIQLKTVSEYEKEIKRINGDNNISAVYNLILCLEKPDGTMQDEKQNFLYYLENCKKPGIALNYEYSRLGFFGGVAVDFTAMGHQAAEMGIKILNGTDIKKIPIADAEKYMVIFNKARAMHLGISIPKDLELIADHIYYSMALMK